MEGRTPAMAARWTTSLYGISGKKLVHLLRFSDISFKNLDVIFWNTQLVHLGLYRFDVTPFDFGVIEIIKVVHKQQLYVRILIRLPLGGSQ